MKEKKSFAEKFKELNKWTLVAEVLLIVIFVFSTWQVVDYLIESKKESDFNNDLVDSAVSKVDPEDEYNLPSDAIETLEDPAEESNVLTYPDIKVDLLKVKEQYPSVVGWLYCPNTQINYPVVQGKDNAYYVKRMPNGASNAAGSIFMDYRDNAALTDFAHVLYGHNMKNNSMFGTVLEYRKEGYFEEHPYMFYFTEGKTYRLEIFAGVNTISTSNLYLEPAEDKRAEFINNAIAKSTFTSSVNVTAQDRIFLMSTCSGSVGQNKRYVLFSKLTEI